jgi:hypothetical protein
MGGNFGSPHRIETGSACVSRLDSGQKAASVGYLFSFRLSLIEPSPENLHPMASQVDLGQQSCGDESGLTGLAQSGWLVELRLAEREADPRFFAVGARGVGDAEEAILRYPGIVREDKRIALRPLSDKEIACLRLRTDSVRPYILHAI